MINKIKGLSIYLFACLSLIVIATQFRGVDLAKHNEVLDYFRELREQEVRIDEEVLELRYGLQNHYDSLFKILQSNKNTFELLQKDFSSLKNFINAEVVTNSKVYYELILEKEAYLEEFAAENSTLNNSLHFFPGLMDRVIHETSLNQTFFEWNRLLIDLLQRVSVYVFSGDKNRRVAILKTLEQLKSSEMVFSKDLKRSLAGAIRHAEIIVEQKPMVDGLVAKLLAMPRIDYLNRFHQAYLEAHQKALIRSKYQRRGLLVACFFLFIGIGYFIFRVRKSSSNLKSIITRNSDAIFVIGVNGTILFVNPAAEKMFGRSSKDLLGTDFGFPALQGETAEVQTFSLEGKPRIAEMRVVETEWESKKAKLATLRDVTDKKQLFEQLIQSQKMESVGHLAGGVAHDFNNLLTVINGYTEMLTELTKDSEKVQRYLKEVAIAGKSAVNLTRQLLAFSRREIIAPKVFDLNHLVVDIEKMLKRLIGEHIELVTHLNNDLGHIKADPGQVEQLLLNLAVNARDAMLEGGKLTIETQNLKLDQKYSDTHPDAPPGDYVLLTVSDNGKGIPGEVKSRIFEPFFTTKGKGRGTGLGLSTCYGIVKRMSGTIQVYSEVEHGTTFKVYFPRCHEEADLLIAQKNSEPIPQGNETILLVEDETGVRQFAVSILREKGYEVFEAREGEEALRIAKAHKKNQIHLLLTDVVMPNMNGRELSAEVKKLYPEIQVLFMSGYTDDTIVRHGVLEKEMNFIQKPFSPKALAFKVREVFDHEQLTS